MNVNQPPLRIGLLLDSWSVPQWIFSIIEEIQSRSDAEIALVVLNAARPAPRTLRARVKDANLLLYSAYVKLDEKLFGKGIRDSAFTPIDARSALENVPCLEVSAVQTRWTDRFPDADLRAVQEARLDVLLRFGFRILKGGILDAARYGVWSFHHDDNRLYRGGPALFWEMAEGNPESGTILQILSEKLDGGRVLYRSTAATDFTSFLRNRNATYWKTARFVGRRLRDLRRVGLDALIEPGSSEIAYDRGIYRIPRTAAMLRFLAKTAWRNARNQLKQRFGREQWFIAYAPRTGSVVRSRPPFSRITPPSDRFYADPFVTERDGRAYLFFEDYPYRTGKGVISCLELRAGSLDQPRVVLERDYHLSYPAVFEWEGEFFMTPETELSGNVELYRATDFPWTWELDTVLLRGVRAVDPSIFRYGSRFWMFVTMAERGASTHDEVSLFYADTLRGPWTPHERNPVVSDVRSARPAGFPFLEDGVLYRPSQNCALAYGHSIAIQRIDEISVDRYRETSVATIQPEWVGSSLCTHTLNASERWVVTDGKRRRWHFTRPR